MKSKEWFMGYFAKRVKEITLNHPFRLSNMVISGVFSVQTVWWSPSLHTTHLELWLWTRTCAALSAGTCAQKGGGCRWTPWLPGVSWGAPRAPSGGVCPGNTAEAARAAGPRQVFGGVSTRLQPARSRLLWRRQAAGLFEGWAASQVGGRGRNKMGGNLMENKPGYRRSPETTWRFTNFNFTLACVNTRVL